MMTDPDQVEELIDRWLKERTFHHRDFADISRLVRLKEEQNVTISLCLPTLNVENTLGAILATVKKALLEDFPLLDEIAIIDSRSTDCTVEIAEKAGVKVYFDDELLPSMGTEKGKGEALWKSLAALKGEIIVWIDSDIENIHPRFVYGVVGPLLVHPEIDLVKAYYKRPLKNGETYDEMGGGRVTEILTRPALNLFYPELSVFYQPMSGEYAARRSILETISFYTGYAVELGLLVEVLRRKGLTAMAQVDLEERVHRNQPTPALAKMSFGILQSLMLMLEEDGLIRTLAPCYQTLRAIDFRKGRYSFSEHEIKVVQRPPLNTVTEYVTQRK